MFTKSHVQLNLLVSLRWVVLRFLFLKILVYAFFCLLVVSCKQNPRQVEYQVLQSFLRFNESGILEKRDIPDLLFDVQSPNSTLGRAVRLNSNLFLTNFHVVNKQSSAQLVPQSKRGALKDNTGKFDIIYFDKGRDLALLRLVQTKPNKSNYVHLYDKMPVANDKVSEFLDLVGDEMEHTGYKKDFGGRDIYDKDKYLSYVGSFILPPNSSLFEKKGLVFHFDQTKMDILTKKHPSKAEVEILTSIVIYQGESGSPVFLEITRNKYVLIGLTTKALDLGEQIFTPGDPLGFSAYARTANLVVHRDAIQQFVQNYLTAQKQVLIPRD